jgi:hypothetical protein
MREKEWPINERRFVRALVLLARQEGWRSLYRGLGPHLMRCVPNAAIMFSCYEMFCRTAAKMLDKNSASDAIIAVESSTDDAEY